MTDIFVTYVFQDASLPMPNTQTPGSSRDLRITCHLVTFILVINMNDWGTDCTYYEGNQEPLHPHQSCSKMQWNVCASITSQFRILVFTFKLHPSPSLKLSCCRYGHLFVLMLTTLILKKTVKRYATLCLIEHLFTSWAVKLLHQL